VSVQAQCKALKMNNLWIRCGRAVRDRGAARAVSGLHGVRMKCASTDAFGRLATLQAKHYMWCFVKDGFIAFCSRSGRRLDGTGVSAGLLPGEPLTVEIRLAAATGGREGRRVCLCPGRSVMSRRFPWRRRTERGGCQQHVYGCHLAAP